MSPPNYKWIAYRISNLDRKCTWHFEKKTQPVLLRNRFLLSPKGGVRLGYYSCRIHSKCCSAYDLTEQLFLCKQIQIFLLIVVHVQRYLPVQLMFCSIPALYVFFLKKQTWWIALLTVVDGGKSWKPHQGRDLMDKIGNAVT